MLILDESTGALDRVTEAEVLDKLLAHRRGKTIIIISHPPRVIQQFKIDISCSPRREGLSGCLPSMMANGALYVLQRKARERLPGLVRLLTSCTILNKT